VFKASSGGSHLTKLFSLRSSVPPVAWAAEQPLLDAHNNKRRLKMANALLVAVKKIKVSRTRCKSSRIVFQQCVTAVSLAVILVFVPIFFPLNQRTRGD
jgi:hypothetical protein